MKNIIFATSMIVAISIAGLVGARAETGPAGQSVTSTNPMDAQAKMSKKKMMMMKKKKMMKKDM